MKKRILTRAAKMGAKILLSLLVLLLALTGCNAPKTPIDTTPEETPEVTPGETTEDLVEDNTVPNEDTTAEPETEETVEKNTYEALELLLGKSYREPTKLCAEIFYWPSYINGTDPRDLEIRDGSIYEDSIYQPGKYNLFYVEDLICNYENIITDFSFNPRFKKQEAWVQSKIMRVTEMLQNQKSGYLFVHEANEGMAFAVYCIEDTLYFVTLSFYDTQPCPYADLIHSVSIP